MKQPLQETYLIELPEQASALINPLRAEILAQLKQPSSATEVAKKLKETPQRINYHLKTLQKVGLVTKVGTRQVRNLVEVLYQSIAKTFLLSETLSIRKDTIQKMKDQGSLLHLIHTSERMRQDALLLMEQSDQNEVIPSASLQMQVNLANESIREQFVEDYVSLVKNLVKKYQTIKDHTNPYQVLLSVYPDPDQGSCDENE
ncbi:helix-turn-helix domain-containing protein [Shimazuella sp. AN120528]|uniref:ArsR/SmtB family transcription factor n=1 Tax=Shimazuella soli TaxID=1892854 RepID=UPI001F102C13|nr:helix-turn-helix domain-containing protein [Shimazuella soli]MCH5584996.1 helix-turn-helix domain-containing protein [Shimazuella soli]